MAQLSTNLLTLPNSGGILAPKRPKVHYAQVVAKSSNTSSKPVVVSEEFRPAFWEVEHKPPTEQYRCTTTYIVGGTSNHHYFKSIQCGKDWCHDCGQVHSKTHRRRIETIFPRLRTSLNSGNAIGYMVITVPKNLRHKFWDKEVLTDFRKYWKDKLKREGYKYGIIRYHWAGEDGYYWHPHLNILFPAGFIPEKTLYRWRDELSKWFSEYFGLQPERVWNPETKKMEQNFPTSNIYFHYLKPTTENAEDKLYHWVKYVTRATQTQPNKVTMKVIYKFRNTSVFGGKAWPVTLLKEEEVLAAARKGYEIDEETGECEKIIWEKDNCPNTGKLIPKRVSAPFVFSNKCEKIGTGFFRLKIRKIPDNYKPIKIPIPERPAWLDKPKIKTGPEKTENIFCPF